jgi:tripartite-type tricarboxylate transporter receptor subunit TctC
MRKLLLLSLSLLLAPFGICAQDYPTRTVRMVMPFAPGGPTDIVARVVAERLTARLGQPVVVENRAGANGIIGTEYVARATPHGYTLLVAPTSHAINPSIYKKLPYDTLRDFASVAYLGASPCMVLVVGKGVEAKAPRDLVTMAKGGKLAYGSAGTGNFTHLAAVYFNMVTGTDLLHVPYKGAGPMVAALYSGEIQVAFLGPVQAINLVKDGRLRALAVTGEKRLPQLPEVPTMREAGYADYDFDGGIQAAVYAPAQTPSAVIQKLNQEINVVLDEPEVKSRFAQMALEGAGGPPEVLDRQVRTKMKKYAAIVKAANIEPE